MWESVSGKLPVSYILGSSYEVATRSAFQSRLDVLSFDTVDRSVHSNLSCARVCVCALLSSALLISLLSSVAVVIINIIESANRSGIA